MKIFTVEGEFFSCWRTDRQTWASE